MIDRQACVCWSPHLTLTISSWLIWPTQNDAKNLKNDWNPGSWVLIWEHSARAIQWIPTWQGLDVFLKSLHSCALDESSPSIRRVKPIHHQIGLRIYPIGLQGTTLTFAATCPVGQVRFYFHLPYSNFHFPLKNCMFYNTCISFKTK